MLQQGENEGNSLPTLHRTTLHSNQSTEEDFYTRSKSDPRSLSRLHSVFRAVPCSLSLSLFLPLPPTMTLTSDPLIEVLKSAVISPASLCGSSLENNSIWETPQQEFKINIKLSQRRTKLPICICDECAFLPFTKSNLVPLNQLGSNYAWCPRRGTFSQSIWVFDLWVLLRKVQHAVGYSLVTSRRFIEASVAAAACVYPKHKETSRAEMTALLYPI